MRCPALTFWSAARDFSPLGHVDVLILQQGNVRAHQVVIVSPQGTFTDRTGLACDFQAEAITAYDEGSGQWSNQALLGKVCPG